MDSDSAKKWLIFNGKPECFLTWKTRFCAYLMTKNIQIETENVPEDSRQANNINLYRELIMHLDDNLLQAVISSGANDGRKVWKYLDQNFGQIKVSQILQLCKQFIDAKVGPGGTVPCYLNSSDVLVF